MQFGYFALPERQRSSSKHLTGMRCPSSFFCVHFSCVTLLKFHLDLRFVTSGDEEELQVRGEEDGPSEDGPSQWPVCVQEAGP